jgi:hypothetical protein
MALAGSTREADRKVFPEPCIHRATGRVRGPGGVPDEPRGQGDGCWTVLMAAPAVCPECFGRGWRLYRVETVEGEEEWAWELCPECEAETPSPRRRARRCELRVF